MIAKRTATLVALSLFLSACGGLVTSDEDGSPSVAPISETIAPSTSTTAAAQPVSTVDDGFPVVVATGTGEVVVEARPEAIVSLSPTATEMLFAVGAGGQVIAVDEYSTFPASAPITDLSGFTPNFEAIVSYEPDLVIVSNDIDDIIATLGGLDIPVLLMPAVLTIEDTFAQTESVGAATGHTTEAEELVTQLRGELETIVETLPTPGEPLTYYHELDPSLYSITSATFIGHVYSLLGLENIADPADADGFGYPQLSAEHIVASDPDLIFVTDCCGESPDTFAARSGWESITAVKNGAVIVVDDDVASRWGPRTIEFLKAVAESIASLRSAG